MEITNRTNRILSRNKLMDHLIEFFLEKKTNRKYSGKITNRTNRILSRNNKSNPF